MMETTALIEEIALATWPAEERVDLDGWALRASQGVTGRGNSVWPNRDNGRFSLQQKIEAAESFYQTRHLPVRFQLNPMSQPANLKAVLLERGYQQTSTLMVQTAVSPQNMPLLNPRFTCAQSNSVTDLWLDFHQRENGYCDENTAVRAGIMRRIPVPCCYLVLQQDGKTVGIGSAIVMNGWVGILNMRTVKEAQNQGVGTAVLRQLLCWGNKQGAKQTFLQVSAQNQPAQALYRKFGYQTVYEYGYFERKGLGIGG